MDRDPCPFNTVVQETDVRDALGQGLDQIDRIGLDCGSHLRDETSVVDRVVQVVGGGRGTGVDPQDEVDDEDLPVSLLVLEDPVVREALDPRDRERVLRSARSARLEGLVLRSARSARLEGRVLRRARSAGFLRPQPCLQRS